MKRPPDDGGNFDMCLLRLNPDGSLDGSFGDKGKIILAGPEDDQALRVFTFADERIILVGQSTSSSGVFSLPGNPSLFRQCLVGLITPEGALKNLFSIGLEGEDKPTSCVVEATGRVVVTGFRLPTVSKEYEDDDPEAAMRQLWVHAFEL